MRKMFLRLVRWSREMGEKHSISPWIFAILYFGTIPPYGYAVYRFILSIRKSLAEMLIWLAVVLATFALPYLYVIFFGKNLPRRFYYILGAWVAIALIAATYRIIIRL